MDTVAKAFRAVEARASNDCTDGSCFHDLGEVADRPHGIGASCLGQADVIDVDSTGGCRRVTAHSLESIAEFDSYLQWDMSDLPRLVRIRCVKIKIKIKYPCSKNKQKMS